MENKVKDIPVSKLLRLNTVIINSILVMSDADSDSHCADCMRFGSCENCIYG